MLCNSVSVHLHVYLIFAPAYLLPASGLNSTVTHSKMCVHLCTKYVISQVKTDMQAIMVGSTCAARYMMYCPFISVHNIVYVCSNVINLLFSIRGKKSRMYIVLPNVHTLACMHL